MCVILNRVVVFIYYHTRFYTINLQKLHFYHCIKNPQIAIRQKMLFHFPLNNR